MTTEGAGAELVEVVDESGAVLEVVTRAAMRARNLRHRSTFVVVVTTAGQVVAHRRADDKDVWPGRWDLGFGGVVGVGEAWRTAAVRELAEEAGVAVAEDALVPLVEGVYTDGDVAEVARVFTAVHDGPFTCPDGEVAELALVPWESLDTWAASHDLCPDTVAMLVPALMAAPGRPR
ncbi:MAG TPA: NUDIX domain-containing protein [Acidimicrobiales bacterium]|nr:NUDIX domain-containing protein [Acidimicrobiales bacterium]